ncbi:MAG: zinc-dependent alcohol dehydrogenase family protein [Myxococcota bacterium]
MKCVEIQGAFGLDHLTLTERPSIPLQEGQVRVAVKAASLNYRDLMTVQGQYNPRQKLPLIPCSDGAGEVLEVGPGVRELKAGDRVMTLFAQGWLSGEPSREKLRSTLGGPLDGTLTEELVLPASGLVLVPEHLTDEEAATLPCAALTAWSALVTHGGLKAGDWVLVQGSGGVSLFVLQFARMFGARVVALSGSDEKLARLQMLGAEHGINYRSTPRWGKVVETYTGGGVDHMVEVGGPATLEQSIAATRIGGQITLIGVLGGGAQPVNLVPLFMKHIRLQGLLVGSREGFEAMNRAISASQLRPVLDSSFALSEARAAFERMAGAQHFGKITVRMG